MMLQGSLEGFSLADVLGLLAAGSKSGRLRITDDRGTGSLWLEAGKLTKGVVGDRSDASLDETVFELMRFDSGDFFFDIDERSPDPDEPVEVVDVVTEATHRLEEWRSIAAVVPSLEHVVTPVEDLPEGSITLNNDEWRVLLSCVPSATVGTVCAAIEMGEVDGSRAVKGLIDRDVIELSEPEPSREPWSAVPVEGGADDDFAVADVTVVDIPSDDDAFEDSMVDGVVVDDAPVEAFSGMESDHPVSGEAFSSELFETADLGDADHATEQFAEEQGGVRPIPRPEVPSLPDFAVAAGSVDESRAETDWTDPAAWGAVEETSESAADTNGPWGREHDSVDFVDEPAFSPADVPGMPPPPAPTPVPMPADASSFSENVVDDLSDGHGDADEDEDEGSLLMRYLKSES